jgi:hypothetical protein
MLLSLLTFLWSMWTHRKKKNAIFWDFESCSLVKVLLSLLLAFSAYSLTLKMEAVRSSETSVNVYQTTRSNLPKRSYSPTHHRWDNLSSRNRRTRLPRPPVQTSASACVTVNKPRADLKRTVSCEHADWSGGPSVLPRKLLEGYLISSWTDALKSTQGVWNFNINWALETKRGGRKVSNTLFFISKNCMSMFQSNNNSVYDKQRLHISASNVCHIKPFLLNV